MLGLLSARTHQVFTAVALRGSHRLRCEGQRERSDVPQAGSRGDPALLAVRRARGQGRRLRRAGPCGAVHRAHRRQLFRDHGPAAVRDRRAASVPRSGAQADDRDPRQRHPARSPRCAGRERRAAGVASSSARVAAGSSAIIYKGRVSRVLPGMQAAFVDIGLERTAFLHASDIVHPRRRREARGPPPRAAPTTSASWCSEGREILVQVLKDPLGTKGARLTTFITIPSRYLVYMPYGRGVGVSARIEDEARARCGCATRADLFVRSGEAGGYIVRTAAEGADAEALRADMLFLRKLWAVLVREGARDARAGDARLRGPAACRCACMRDLVGERRRQGERRSRETLRAHAGVRRALHARLGRRASSSTPGERPIFDLYGVEEEIQRSLDRKVPLKSGGYLIIDQTEAMTTIDVNTGAFVGHRNLEETIFRTNLEAAVAIARQLRLRNLGGIIIIDFIDMQEEEHRRQVLQALEKCAGQRPRQDARLDCLAARPGRDDAQAHAREPGAPAVPAVSDLRRPRLRQDAGDRLLRDLPRDPAPGAPVRVPGADGAGAPGRHRAAARRGVRGARRARGAHRQADPPADRSACTSRTSTTWC